MSHATDEKDRSDQLAAAPDPTPDPRRPYEPPRIVKKRSIERATLTTVMGPMMTGLTVMG